MPSSPLRVVPGALPPSPWKIWTLHFLESLAFSYPSQRPFQPEWKCRNDVTYHFFKTAIHHIKVKLFKTRRNFCTCVLKIRLDSFIIYPFLSRSCPLSTLCSFLLLLLSLSTILLLLPCLQGVSTDKHVAVCRGRPLMAACSRFWTLRSACKFDDITIWDLTLVLLLCHMQEHI